MGMESFDDASSSHVADLPRRKLLSRGITGAVAAIAAWNVGGPARAQAENKAGEIPTKLTHLGICVSDVEKSGRFYQALGFTVEKIERLGRTSAKLLQVDADLTVRYIRKDGYAFHLVQYTPLPVKTEAVPHAMNRFGLTNLSLNVDDFDKAVSLIKSMGGNVLEQTRSQLQSGGKTINVMMCTDPDGLLLEIVGHAAT